MNYSHDIGNALTMFCHEIYFHNQVIEIKPASDVSVIAPLVILTNCLLVAVISCNNECLHAQRVNWYGI